MFCVLSLPAFFYIIKGFSAPLGGFADIFENVRSDIGQAYAIFASNF